MSSQMPRYFILNLFERRRRMQMTTIPLNETSCASTLQAASPHNRIPTVKALVAGRGREVYLAAVTPLEDDSGEDEFSYEAAKRAHAIGVSPAVGIPCSHCN